MEATKERTISTFNFKINLKVSTRAIGSVIAFVLTFAFTYLQVVDYLIPGIKEIYNLKPETTTTHQIGLIWVPIVSYFLISWNVCLLKNIFKKLRSYKENGLIFCLIYGFTRGLTCSVIFGIIIGIVIGFIPGFIFTLIYFLSIGLIFGLIIGLIIELLN